MHNVYVVTMSASLVKRVHSFVWFILFTLFAMLLALVLLVVYFHPVSVLRERTEHQKLERYVKTNSTGLPDCIDLFPERIVFTRLSQYSMYIG